MTTRTTSHSEQQKKLGQAAREFGCDEDEARFDERLKKVAGQKPPAGPPPAPKKREPGPK